MEVLLDNIFKGPRHPKVVGSVGGGLEIKVQCDSSMGRAEVAHSDRKVADKLHAAGVAEDEIPPSRLVSMMCKACVGCGWLAPLVGHSAKVDPPAFLNKMKKSRKVTNIAIEVPNQGPLWPELGVFIASLCDLAGPGCCPRGLMAASVAIDHIKMDQASCFASSESK